MLPPVTKALLAVLQTNSSGRDVQSLAPLFSVLLHRASSLFSQVQEPSLFASSKGLDPFRIHRAILRSQGLPPAPEKLPPSPNPAAAPAPLNLRVSSHEPSLVLNSPPSGEERAPFSLVQLAARIARKYEIPERFFENLVRTESAFQPRALSPKGAMGLGQLMPATARELGLRVEAGEAEGSVWHPPSNLDASARYLRWLYGQFGGEGKSGEEVWPLAAGAYNAGIGNIRRALAKVRDAEPPVWNSVARVLPEVTGRAAAETLRYVERVMG